jgi:hypothetical protein
MIGHRLSGSALAFLASHLFLDFRFYLPKKTIEAKSDRAKMNGKILPFQTKLSQAGSILGNANVFKISTY